LTEQKGKRAGECSEPHHRGGVVRGSCNSGVQDILSTLKSCLLRAKEVAFQLRVVYSGPKRWLFSWESSFQCQRAGFLAEKSSPQGQRGGFSAEKSSFQGQRGGFSAEKSSFQGQKGAFSAEKSPFQRIHHVLGFQFGPATKNIQKILVSSFEVSCGTIWVTL
jgi:hypothetical protein